MVIIVRYEARILVEEVDAEMLSSLTEHKVGSSPSSTLTPS